MAPNESHPEVVLADALRRRDVPGRAPGHASIRAATVSPFRIDLAVPASAGASSSTSTPSTASLEGHAADAERRRELHRLAWQIETVSEHDMRDPSASPTSSPSLYRLRRRRPAHPSVS